MLEKASSIPPINQTLSNKLHKRLRLQVMAGLVFTSILIGTSFTIMMYRSHAKQLEDKLLFEIELGSDALHSELSKYKSLAVQITSRSGIRYELEKYQQGQIDLEALIAFSAPKLADVMSLATNMIGISRLDVEGKQLIQLGEPIPASVWPENFRSDKPQVGNPRKLNGRYTLVVSVPILNRKGEMLGIDLVAFDSQYMVDIIQGIFLRQQGTGNIQIASVTSTGLQYFFRSGNSDKLQIEDLIDTEVHKALRNIKEDVHRFEGINDTHVIAHHRIGNSNWVVLFLEESKTFYDPAWNNAAYVASSVAILTLIGILLTLFLFKPLAGQISVDANSLRNLLQKVQFSEERLQSILDNMTSVVYLKDLDGKYLLINKLYLDLFHLSREEIIGKTDHDIFPTEIADAFRANDLTVFEKSASIELDEQAPHDDGIHDYTSIKFPLHDVTGKIYGVCGISTDITEHKRSDAFLAESKQLYRDLVENTHDWIWEIDEQARYTYASPRVRDLLGYEPEEILGRTPFDLMPADEAQRVRKAFSTIAEGRLQFNALINVNLHCDGHRVVLETSGTPIFSKRGVFLGYRGIDRDISKRKQLEQREHLRLKILEKMAQSKPLENVLDTLVQLVESEMVDVMCSILLLDESGKHLLNGAAPSLPEFYNEAIHGLQIGPGVGSCGTAAYEDRQVIVEDIRQHPYWAAFTEVATRAGLAACWSEPIRDSQSKVLGTFAMYYSEPRAPQLFEIELITQVARLAGMAIERKQVENELKNSDLRFRTLFELSPDPAWIIDNHHFIECNQAAVIILGYQTKDEFLNTHPGELSPQQQPDGEDSFKKAERMMRAAQDKGTHRFEWVHIRADSSEFFAEVTLSAITLQNRPVIYCTWRDITERKLADDKLLENESRLRAMFDVAQDGILVVDLETKKLLDANPTFCTMGGYQRNELLKMTVKDLHPEADLPIVLEKFAMQAHGESVLAENVPILCKNGNVFPSDITTSLLQINGRACMMGFFRDITERKQAENELNAYWDKLEELVADRTAKLEEITTYNRTLFETSPIGLVLCDMDGNLVDVNPSFLKIIGYSETQAKSLSYWDITPNEYKEQEQIQQQALEKSGRYGPYEKEYLHKDSHRVPVRLNGLLIEQGGKPYIWSSVEDITELKANQQQLETVIENLPAVFFIKDSDGRHLLVNRRFEEATGVRKNQVIGHTDYKIFPQDTADTIAKKDQVVLAGKVPITFEERVPHPDGTIHDYQSTKVPLFNELGQTYGLFGISSDITESKTLQRELAQSRDNAERLAQAKSEFLANMSHEIRTPLNGVLGLARMGERGTSKETINLFGKITNSGEHLLHIVNDILDFSRIEAGKMEVETRPFNLIASVENSVDLFRKQAEDKGLLFQMEIANGLPSWVQGDALRLEQILINLLSNAIKFTEQGEVKLHATKLNSELLQFNISDSGIGMSEKQLTQLFKPFEQADSSTTRRFGGTGLGLSISINLAQIMGGDIQVISHLGKGSKFILTFPLQLATPQFETDAHILPTSGQRLRGLHFLAAEDVEINRLILADLLDHEGASVLFAENGQQALDQLEEKGINAFDAVLMDIQMPVMGGYESSRRIHELSPEIPVIGLTAHALVEEKVRCLDNGMVDHVAKPIDAEILVNVIQRYVNSSAQDLYSPISTTKDESKHTQNSQTTQSSVISEIKLDLPGIDTRAGLYVTGNIDFYLELLQRFLQRDDFEKTFRAAQSESDNDAAMRAAHSLKGIAANLGMKDVQAAAEELEYACEEHTNIDNCLLLVVSKLQRVVHGLENFFSS